jgi:hypothetical protein
MIIDNSSVLAHVPTCASAPILWPPRWAAWLSDMEHCVCGAEWEHDGNGGRFCLGCGWNHPLAPSLPLDSDADT